MLSSLVLLCSIAYPLVIYNVFDALVARFSINATQVASLKTQVLTWLVIFQILFTLIVFVIGIFFSHKIAGPMYKLVNYLKDVRSGSEATGVYFRSGDYFQEVANEVNKTLNFIQEREINDIKYIKEINAFLNNISLVVPEDKKPVIQEITSKLSEIEQRHTIIN